MLGIAGDAKNGQPCYSLFHLRHAALRARSAPEPLKGKRDFDKAKQLIKEAGYKGEKIVVCRRPTSRSCTRQALVTAELLQELGAQRRLAGRRLGHADHAGAPSKEPIDKGGWNIFHTWLVGPDMANPAINYPHARIGRESVVRLAERPEDRGAARRVVRRTRCRHPEEAGGRGAAARAGDSCRIIPTAQFILPTAYRTNISGVIIAPIAFLWNVEKK